MSYSGHRRTPPRSLLVIIGGVIAWVGLVCGSLIATPEYHRALTMKPEPVEMTWQQLVDQGLTDNTHVRLTDVELIQSNPMGMLEDLLGQFDPDAPIEDQQEAFQLAAEDLNIAEFAETVLQPIKVVPRGSDPDQVPMRIVVPQTAWATEAANRELEESGTLTGRFTLQKGNGFEFQLTKLLLAGSAAAVEQAAAQSNPQLQEPTNREVENSSEESLENVAESDVAEKGDTMADDEPRWVFEPVHGVPDVTQAQQWFWLSGLAVAVGLVVCGAGGPSISCCVFFQGPSLLSLLGFPMRYGRAGKMTRIVYVGIGIGLLSYGYQKMIVEGHFGQIDGDIGLAVLGYIAGSVGAAALLGSLTNATMQKIDINLDPKPSKKAAEPKMSFTDACSLEPTEADLATHYVDSVLINEYNAEIPEAMAAIADCYSGVGFSSPEPVVWMKQEQHLPSLIQLGCQGMVVADVENVDDEIQMRLVSVLHDGFAMITLSPNFRTQKSTRLGTSGLYLMAESDDPMEMLSAHLEQTASMAEKRDTSVVSIEANEITDVALYARRALADVQAQYGETLVEVGDANYGRFRFPVMAIAQLQGVGSNGND